MKNMIGILLAFQVFVDGSYAMLVVMLPESPKWLANSHGQKSRGILERLYVTQYEINESIRSFKQSRGNTEVEHPIPSIFKLSC